MTPTTRDQRVALKHVFDRGTLYTNIVHGVNQSHPPKCTCCGQPNVRAPKVTYRQFRKTVQPTFGMDGAITVPWCGMWLAIERDGYTHS